RPERAGGGDAGRRADRRFRATGRRRGSRPGTTREFARARPAWGRPTPCSSRHGPRATPPRDESRSRRPRAPISGRCRPPPRARWPSALPRLQASADDLLAGPLGQIHPGITLGVAPGRPGARGVGGLTVVLSGLRDAVAFLVVERRHRRRAPL